MTDATYLEAIYRNIPLGRNVEPPSRYDPSTLVGISRELARSVEGIDATSFYGQDLWNCWEISWLNSSGRPEVRIGQLLVPADSPNICESKSLKLYLNSFGNEIFESCEEVKVRVVDDLSQLLGVVPQFELYPIFDSRFIVQTPKGLCLDALQVNLAVYEPTKELLQIDSHQPGKADFYTNLFRSNCPVTSQPDWASVVVKYQADTYLHPESLLAYLVSYRNHTGFHEACIERIFCDLALILQPEKLLVWAGFMRRGGLDINPIRSLNHDTFLPPRLARH